MAGSKIFAQYVDPEYNFFHGGPFLGDNTDKPPNDGDRFGGHVIYGHRLGDGV